MKDQKFNAKAFLNVKTLSPLESQVIKGGTADEEADKKIKIRIKDTV